MKLNIVDTQFTVKRGGTSRLQRQLPALKTDYVLPEERDMADFLILLQKYSKHLQFHNLQNQKDGDWSKLLGKDLSYLLAVISKENVNLILYFFTHDFLNEVDSKAGFKNIFDFLFSLLYRLDQQFLSLPSDHPLFTQITNLIQGKLASDLNQLVGYYKAGIDKNLIDENSSDYLFEFPIETWASQDVVSTGFSAPWFKTSAGSWNDLYTKLSADNSLFGNPLPASNAERMANAKEALAVLFDRIFRIWGRIVASAGQYFEESITTYQNHQPHVSLLLSFLKLMDHAHNHLNTYTQQHLDFYYQQVLGLDKKTAEPSHVHVIVNLQKNVDEYLLEKGTPLKAGKDNSGKNVIFEVESDTALNKAKVELLHSVFVEKKDSNAPDDEARLVKRVYSAPVANSVEGLEALEDNQRWPQFGTNQMQLPELGFAIASTMLFLEEGTREIVIAIEADAVIDQSGFDHTHFKAEITGEKDWVEVPLSDPGSLDLPNDNKLYFYGKLAADADSTFPYNAEVHGGAFETTLPLLRIVLKNDRDALYPYQPLKNIRVQKIDLEVRVTASTNVQVETSLGPVNSSKPFYPFGPQPQKGDYLKIGHHEAASKNLTSVEVALEWKTLKDYGLGNDKLVYFKSILDYLNGTYSFENSRHKVQASYPILPTLASETKDVFHPYDFIGETTLQELTALVLLVLFFGGTIDFTLPIFQYLLGAEGNPGFATFEKDFANLNRIKNIEEGLEEGDFDNITIMKLKLIAPDFGHSEYPNLLSQAAIDPDNNELPEQPFTPEVSSVTLNYTAAQTIDFTTFPVIEKMQAQAFENRTAQFFHAHTFGAQELHPYLTTTADNIPLMPQFAGEGEFYIGIKDLQPPQNLSILFQLAEGSENPLKNNPEVHWSYLENNNWVPFEDVQVSDATDNLVKSGIITFSFPKGANSTNTLLSSGYHWIRAHVESDTDGVSHAIAVLAQAARAVFKDQNNDFKILSTPLEAGSIKGLVVKDAAIKKVSQPFNSFAGRSAEEDETFYTRVSERLRHKERAITMWDYEHLVLEHFPAIYKVKCLPHTHIGSGIYNEKRPGHLAIIPIPNIKSDLAADPLKPYTSKALRNEIENFLKAHTSGWVELTVDNPQFEQVQVNCVVELREGYDETLFKRKLQEDITRFLSPWAFDETSKIDFGGSIHESVILDFIEEREYVNYLRDLVVKQKNGDTRAQSVKEATASTGRSILVSVPQEEHLIIIEKVCVS
jgi:hypothetical protein